MYIKKHNSVMGKGFTVDQLIKDKMWKFYVNDNGHSTDTVYKYRAIVKCKAGFLTISEGEATLHQIATSYKPNSLHSIDILNAHGNYVHVLAMKGGKFYIIDLAIIESLNVGDIHGSFPKMADYAYWETIGSKTWADKAYQIENDYSFA